MTLAISLASKSIPLFVVFFDKILVVRYSKLVSWCVDRAAALVLKAHKEAVNSLSGNGRAKLGTVAAVVAAANSTTREAMKDVQVPMRPSSVTSSQFSQPAVADTLDNGAVLKVFLSAITLLRLY